MTKKSSTEKIIFAKKKIFLAEKSFGNLKFTTLMIKFISTYTYDWLLSIASILLYFPIIDTIILGVKSYLLVLTVQRRAETKKGIFSCSAILERGELLLTVIPKLFITYFYLTRLWDSYRKNPKV